MLATAYLGLILCMFLTEIKRKKTGKLDFLTLANLIFFLVYAFPGFVLSANLENARHELNWGNTLYTDNPQTVIAIFVGYVLIVIGFYSKSAEKFGKTITIKSYSDKVVIVFALFLLLFSCLSIQIYGSQYGGVMVALAKSHLIRSTTVESGNLVFFKNFMFFSFFASYLLAALVFFSNLKKCKFILFSLFLLSVVASWISATLTAGRIPFVRYIIGFYLVYVLKTGKFSFTFTLTFVSSAALFLIHGKTLFFSLSALPDGYVAVVERFRQSLDSGSNESFSIIELVENFVFPVHSLDAAFNNHYPMRLFLDIYYGVLSLIPERLTNMEFPETLSFENTANIIGSNEFAIPPGILAFGIYSMSWIGLIIISLSFGWIGRYLQTIFNNQLHTIYWMPFVYILTAVTWIDFITFGDPEAYLIANFWFFAAMGLLLSFVSKVYWKKNYRL
ncbi:hypothetical protein BJP36_19115 [Moorena producens JHB]|uniref:Oligosaccharide repeat unit polymerase n=1 Tax=Moorena producens (strain JHB) TaxID=1454205 RepID=A0A1D9G2G2_MOOP1|nr:hypothetical protein [Moorena producens]AOY81705.1 hypothetical protein BJP36_19115 [Moorena producens JHB]